MSNKKWKAIPIIIIIIAAAAFLLMRSRGAPKGEAVRIIEPAYGSIKNVISTTGTVLPQNRLELKPPINGRVEKILVKEGDKVKTGQNLALMSSTERAALLDAAKDKGSDAVKYWEEAYKPIPLLAPIDGEVIVATVQPGQTVTTADAVLVLSDRLIVRAQVDETDIGKVKVGMPAEITLDAYPDAKVKVSVEHIYYESKTVNNVTIYEVDLIPGEVPVYFRSGMNATVDFIDQERENILLVPLEAVHKDNGEIYVLVSKGAGKEPEKAAVKLGVADEKNAEILSGLTAADKIVVKSQKYELPKKDTSSNPFLPSRRR